MIVDERSIVVVVFHVRSVDINLTLVSHSRFVEIISIIFEAKINYKHNEWKIFDNYRQLLLTLT
jgi:hypothetical protein